MNHQEIFAMALEAGLTDPDLGECMTDYGDAKNQVVAFARLVAAKEREACILEIKMHTPREGHDSPGWARMNRLIYAILARGLL